MPTKVYVHQASVEQNGLRVAVPVGEYDVREIGTEDYEFSQNDEATFTLSATDVATYIQSGGIVIREGSLP